MGNCGPMKEPRLTQKLSSTWDNGSAVLRARWYLRSAQELGSGVRIWGHPIIKNSGTLRLGEKVRMVSTPARLELGIGSNGTLEIGSHTYINYGCSIGATLLVRLGPRCRIGSHVILMDNDFHELDPERRDEMPASAPIILEENVWIGVRAIVLRGVTIGAGSVVAAGSVVVRDVPPRTLVGGVPARPIRSL
jgi:acetyltransferase-like isoleucine patch superfamily enzyme